jgi:CarD family transcriptional regulator
MSFQVGEKVVYPNHGVATIENISSRSFAGSLERYNLLRLSTTSLTVMVPFSHAENVGLRRVTRNGQLAKVIEYLSEGRRKRNQDWKDRFRENTEKMQRGNLLEVAEVLKSLLILQAEKPLSFREKKMLDRARQMLLSEISTSRGMPEAEVAKLLDHALAKVQLRLPEPM